MDKKYVYALMTDEEIELLKKLEAEINSRRKEKIYIMGIKSIQAKEA